MNVSDRPFNKSWAKETVKSRGLLVFKWIVEEIQTELKKYGRTSLVIVRKIGGMDIIIESVITENNKLLV